jgi:hypothetical protein
MTKLNSLTVDRKEKEAGKLYHTTIKKKEAKCLKSAFTVISH